MDVQFVDCLVIITNVTKVGRGMTLSGKIFAYQARFTHAPSLKYWKLFEKKQLKYPHPHPTPHIKLIF
jgi:hypothetical protein